MIDGQEFLTEFLEAGKATIAQDTMKDGFATLVDSEGKPFVANLNPTEKERYKETGKPLSKVKKEKGEEGKKEPEAKKTEEKKKPESEKKTEEKKKPESEKKTEEKKSEAEEKKIKITDILGGKTEVNYELTEEQAKKQLKTSKDELEYNKNKVKDFTEKLKVVDKKLPVVDNLYKFYKDYKAALDKFDDDSYLSASQYFDKYKDRFVDVKGEALKKIKSDTSLSYQKTESKLEDLEKEYKDLHGDKYFYTDHIKHQKNEIKRHTNIIKQLENLAQDSALDKCLDNGNNGLDLFINKVNIER